MIEQFWMRRPISHRAEVVGRGDQALAEMMLPDAIDDYPRGERILRAGDRLSEFEPAVVGVLTIIDASQRLQKPPRHGRAWLMEVAANEDVRIERLGGGTDGHRPLDRRTGLERRQLLAELAGDFAVGAEHELKFGRKVREVLANVVARDGNRRIRAEEQIDDLSWPRGRLDFECSADRLHRKCRPLRALSRATCP